MSLKLIAHSLCIANGAPAKVVREGWPGKTALLIGQSIGTNSGLHQSPELTDAHWQLMVGLKSACQTNEEDGGEGGEITRS